MHAAVSRVCVYALCSRSNSVDKQTTNSATARNTAVSACLCYLVRVPTLLHAASFFERGILASKHFFSWTTHLPVLHCAHKTQKQVPTTSRRQWKHVCRRFIFEDFSFFAQTPTVPCGPKFGRPDMSSLVPSRECAKAKALFLCSFRADLVAEV